MNTATTLCDHAVLGAHCPHDPLAPCPRNVATVARLRAAMERTASMHQSVQFIPVTTDKRVIDSTVRGIVDQVLAELTQLRSAS